MSYAIDSDSVVVSSSALPTGAATSALQTSGGQKTQIVDGSGNVIDAGVHASGDYHLSTQVVQDVLADDNNSSTTNLAGPNFTFTGTATSTLGVAAIQVSLKTNVNCTVYVDQSPDTTPNWDITDTFTYNSASGGASWTVQAVNSYVRVRVVGAGASSYFRLQTALCPIVEALPRAPDNQGLRVSIRGLRDQFGFQGQFTPIKDLRVSQPYRLVGTSFTGTTIDSNFWTAASNGTSAAVTQANTKLTLTSGTSAAGYATVQSARQARFIFAHPHMWRGAVRLPDTTEADVTRRWGCFNAAGGPPTVPVDGFWFECAPDGTLSVNWRNNSGTIQTVSSGSFNGDVSAYTLDTNVHAYEIIHFVMGTWFYIDNVLIHTVLPTTDNMSSTYTLRSSFSCVNGASGGESGQLEVWATVIMRLGRDMTAPAYYYFANGTTAGVNLKIGSGSVHKVLILNGTTNSVITLSDSTSATTPTILAHTVSATLTSLPITLDLGGLQFFEGLRLTVATQNAQLLIIYE